MLLGGTEGGRGEIVGLGAHKQEWLHTHTASTYRNAMSRLGCWVAAASALSSSCADLLIVLALPCNVP